jgi:hypothetical protein
MEAHRACVFDLIEVPLSTLRYHVTKKRAELEDMQLDKENTNAPFAAIDIININNELFSRVTLNSSFYNSSQSVLSISSSLNIAPSSIGTSSLSGNTTKSKLSRRNARQASVERLNTKRLKDDYDLRYKSR